MTQVQARPTDDHKTLTIRLRASEEYVAAIDNWRAQYRPVMSRSEAIRVLTLLAIDKGLKPPKPK
jgi:hypothetical protein